MNGKANCAVADLFGQKIDRFVQSVAAITVLLSGTMMSILPTCAAAVRVRGGEMKQIDRFYNKLCIDDVSFQKFKHKTTPC